MIEVKDITKSFEGKTVLHHVSATFETGKTNLIIGQSGSGKTVLMKSLVGLLRPDSGHIYFDGRDLLAMNSAEIKNLHREIGMLFQGSALFDSETVLGNVMFPMIMFSDMSRSEMKDRAMFCIERVNLAGAENKYPAEISGGMQKRAAIARAIALNPKYLFCDEPNSGLDPRTSILIDELLSDITHEYNITTVINTHDMNSVLGIGEHIIFINKGYCDWTGNKDTIFSSTNKELNDFVFATDLFEELREYIVSHGRQAVGAARRDIRENKLIK